MANELTAPVYTPGQQFQFDQNQYLPKIQQQAASIYDPQKAQIEALRSLGQQQTEQTKITTKDQFAKQLQAEVEAINARGAFFGGGALNRQSDINANQTRALNMIDLQQQAQNAQYGGQLAGLNAEQANYVQNQLSGAQNSAYSRWQDSYSMYNQQRQFEQAKLEADRQYKLEKKRLKATLKQNSKEYKMAKKKLDADLSMSQQELAYKYASLNKSGGFTSSSTGASGWGQQEPAYGNGWSVTLNPND